MTKFEAVERNYVEEVKGESVIVRLINLSPAETEKVTHLDNLSTSTISVEDIINDIKNNNHPDIREKDKIMMSAVRNLLLTPYESFGLNKLELPIIDILSQNKDMLMFQIFRGIFICLYDGLSMFVIPENQEDDRNLVHLYKWRTADCPAFNPEFIGLVSKIMYPPTESVYASNLCNNFFEQSKVHESNVPPIAAPFLSNAYSTNSLMENHKLPPYYSIPNEFARRSPSEYVHYNQVLPTDNDDMGEE